MGDLITKSKHESEHGLVGDESSQFLTFHTSGEWFAIGILDVQEIIEITNTTRVPMTPDQLQGVINLRGNVVPVVDLASRLGRNPTIITKRSCIVLVEIEIESDEMQTIGMLVDEVNEILEIPGQYLQSAPDFGTDIRTEFIKSMGRVNDGFIVLLEINTVLSISEISDLTQNSDSHADANDGEPLQSS